MAARQEAEVQLGSGALAGHALNYPRGDGA